MLHSPLGNEQIKVFARDCLRRMIMDLQGWLPLLLSRKEIIISHIGKFYPPYPQCSNEEIVVMDKAGKIYNRKPRMSDKDEILNGDLFLIYIHTDNADSIDEEDAETSLNIMMELLSPQQNEKFIQNCISEQADTSVQKMDIFKRDFPDEYTEYESRAAAYDSVVDFCNFLDIPDIYNKMITIVQESNNIAEYLCHCFSGKNN